VYYANGVCWGPRAGHRRYGQAVACRAGRHILYAGRQESQVSRQSLERGSASASAERQAGMHCTALQCAALCPLAPASLPACQPHPAQ